MTIGSIVVDLLARTGSFETDMNRAAKTAAKRAKEIDDAVSKAGAAVGAALGAAGIAAAYMVKQTIDGLDALNDVADATGASIENLSALEDVALRTGTSMETVSAAVVKFNATLKEADGKNGASQALKAIGLDAEALKKIDPAEALRLTAVALSGFADDGAKARRVQELFGKSVKEVSPFLNDLAEKTELVGKVSKDAAGDAEAFNKQIAGFEKNALDAKRALLGELLPAINKILEALNKGGVMSALDEFGERALGWTSNANSKRIANIKKELAGLNEEAGSIKFDLFGSKSGIARDIEAKTAELRDAEKAYMKFRDRDAGSMAFAPKENKPSVGDAPAVVKEKKAGAARESEYQKYLENLQKELDKTEELTRAAMVLADVKGGRLKLKPGEDINVLLNTAREIDAQKALTEEKKRGAEFDAKLRDQRMADAASHEAAVKSLLDGNEAIRAETALIGKNAEAQAAIEQARLSSAIAMKEEQLARTASTEILTREAAALQEEIRLLTERKELVGLKGTAQQLADDAKKTEELANSIGTSFGSAFEKAAIEGGKFSDVLKGLAKDIAALTLRQAITVPLSQSIGKALNFGGGNALDGLLSSNNAFGTGSNWLADAGKWIGGLFGGKFAAGGTPPMGKISLVGEKGPELFVPNTAGRIVPNHEITGGAGGGMVNNYFTVGDVASMAEVKKVVAASQAQSAGRLGRSRAYGGAFS